MTSRYEALKPQDRTSPVDVFPLLCLDALGIEQLRPTERQAIAGILARQRAPELDNLAGGRSFNAPQCAAATMLLCGDEDQFRAAREFMLALNGYQLGEADPPGELAILRFHGGPEQMGEYWAWRWFCDATALLVGIRRSDALLTEMGRRALEVHAALAALISVPFEEVGGFWDNAKGQQILFGAAFLLLAAERCNEIHVNAQEVSMCFAETIGRPYTWKRPLLFPSVLLVRAAVAAARKAGVALPAFQPSGLTADGVLDPAIVGALKGIRLRSRAHVMRWPDSAAAYLENAENHATPPSLAADFNLKTQEARNLYPFVPGRGFKWPGTATCGIEGGRIVARGPTGEASLDLPPGEPSLEIALGPEGLQVVRGAGQKPPGPHSEPEPPRPPEPVDPRRAAILAAVDRITADLDVIRRAVASGA